MTKLNITYTEPKVFLLQESGLGTSEFAGRTAYNSFDNSEHIEIREVNTFAEDNTLGRSPGAIQALNNVDSSALLDSLAWVHHHHSVLEHCNLTFLIKGTSRGVLAEHSRHRIQSLTVQSTRYTMSPIINAFLADKTINYANTAPSQWFINTLQNLDFLVTNATYNIIEITAIWAKLSYQYNLDPEAFKEASLSKSMITSDALGHSNQQAIFNALQASKQKRNVGDSFKHIVTDNWKCDLVCTFNLRSLKNYFSLRDSGAAYFQIQMLAQAMKAVTPSRYLNLIVKK